MELDLETARQVLRDRVCSVCTDRLVDGSCGIEEVRTCAFDAHLPKILDVVNEIRSDDINDYVTAIRERVCSECEGQDEEGDCKYREGVECALDSYLILVIESLEDARDRLAGGDAAPI